MSGEIRSPADAVLVPARTAIGGLFPQAGVIPIAIAGVLTLATTVECAFSLASWFRALLYGAVLWLWWAGVAEILWRAGKRWPSVLKVFAANAGVQLVAAAIVAALHLATLHFTAHWIAHVGSDAQREVYGQLSFFNLGRFGVEFLTYALVWFACAALHTQLAAQRDAMRSLQLERQLSSAHLRALQMQLEPHFLFNALNAVAALMDLDRKQEALETLEHLNTILKTGLKRNTPSKIPLAQELEIVESYLAIERVRFADRLRVDMNLDPNALDGLVPCFLLQPIIENAIRHGIAQCENDGCIQTSAKRVGTHMQLEVRDNGPGMNGKSHPGFGIGLSNTRERLVHFYQDDFELRANQPTSGGFEVLITIPYERKAP
ncbi:MAG: histidine kinase [Candidatus Sulfotelmatobacter sp.]